MFSWKVGICEDGIRNTKSFLLFKMSRWMVLIWQVVRMIPNSSMHKLTMVSTSMISKVAFTGATKGRVGKPPGVSTAASWTHRHMDSTAAVPQEPLLPTATMLEQGTSTYFIYLNYLLLRCCCLLPLIVMSLLLLLASCFPMLLMCCCCSLVASPCCSCAAAAC